MLFEDLRHGRMEFIAASFFLFAITLIGVPRLARIGSKTLSRLEGLPSQAAPAVSRIRLSKTASQPTNTLWDLRVCLRFADHVREAARQSAGRGERNRGNAAMMIGGASE